MGDVFDDFQQARGGLAEVAADESFVSDGQKRQRELARERRRKAGLAGAGGADQQNLVSRLKRMRAQEGGVADFADEVLKVAYDAAREDKVGYPSGRLGFAKQAAQGFRKHGRHSACEVRRPRRGRGCRTLVGLLRILAVCFVYQRRHGIASGPEITLPCRVQAKCGTSFAHVIVPHRRSPLAQ